MIEEKYIQIKEKIKNVLLFILIMVCIVETVSLLVICDNYMNTKQYHDYIDRECIETSVSNIEYEITNIKKILNEK